jgi:hypothetical protein
MQQFKKILNDFLKKEFVKLALKKILGSVLVGGIKGWLVSFLAEELYEELGEPVVNHVLRKVEKGGNIVIGGIRYKKIEKAKHENDLDDYLNNIGRV